LHGIHFLKPALVLLITGISAFTDLSCSRIYNKVLAPGFIAAAALHIIDRAEISADRAAYIIIFITALFICFVLRLIGGGDVKLYAFIFFIYPDPRGFYITFLSAAAAGVFALWTAAKPAGKTKKAGLTHRIRGPGIYSIIRDSERIVIPMGAFIFLASLAVIISEAVRIWRG